MIQYSAGASNIFWNVFKLRGSVFPMAFRLAFPCALLTVALKVYTQRGGFPALQQEDGVLTNNAAWNGFNTLVGFLVVFRTSQAYARFWDGCIWTRQMRGEWFDACSAVLAFCKHSEAEEWRICDFQHLLVRLFCMLHAVAMAEIEDSTKSNNGDELAAFQMELVDPDNIDKDSLRAIRECDSRVELLFFWIQQVIIENIKTGVLDIPPPILTRAFQEISSGMIAFQQAIKISYIPFPFPYAQCCDCLLFMHWLVVPIVTTTWTSEAYWAAAFSFVQVFILWSLNFIAMELEDPFGLDENDLDCAQMQAEMNRSLVLLLQPEAKRTPRLRFSVRDYHRRDNFGPKSFVECWAKLGKGESTEESPEPIIFAARSWRASRRRHTIVRSPKRKSDSALAANMSWRTPKTRTSSSNVTEPKISRSVSSNSIYSLMGRHSSCAPSTSPSFYAEKSTSSSGPGLNGAEDSSVNGLQRSGSLTIQSAVSTRKALGTDETSDALIHVSSREKVPYKRLVLPTIQSMGSLELPCNTKGVAANNDLSRVATEVPWDDRIVSLGDVVSLGETLKVAIPSKRIHQHIALGAHHENPRARG